MTCSHACGCAAMVQLMHNSLQAHLRSYFQFILHIFLRQSSVQDLSCVCEWLGSSQLSKSFKNTLPQTSAGCNPSSSFKFKILIGGYLANAEQKCLILEEESGTFPRAPWSRESKPKPYHICQNSARRAMGGGAPAGLPDLISYLCA